VKALAEAPVIVIAGPTASGKTALALSFVAELESIGRKAEILCCDSITVYRQLEIGSAKPTAQERALVPHHLVDLVGPEENFTAGEFVRQASRVIESLHKEEKIPLLVGGAGFYLRALLRGMASSEEEEPARAKEIRAKIELRAKEEGFPKLYSELLHLDPGSVVTVHANDHYRILRALQAMELYGKPWSELNKMARASPPRYPGLRYFVLRWERESLLLRVQQRTRAMLQQGLLLEVKSLLDSGVSPEAKPLNSVGYKECLDVLRGSLPEAELEAKIIQETMRLAKRQMTWFRGEEYVEWLDPEFLPQLRSALMLG
jgi:tRNA dimethylallyltransferase